MPEDKTKKSIIINTETDNLSPEELDIVLKVKEESVKRKEEKPRLFIATSKDNVGQEKIGLSITIIGLPKKQPPITTNN